MKGVATVSIPDELLVDSNPLWKCFMVGYFIGDVPHVGPIHATLNRLWSTPGSASKIDVQFIGKNRVLFKIDNAQTRSRVVKRRYWHVSEVPLVVQVWNPETAQSPPDLSAMPLWVDFKSVTSHLFSHKGLKFLANVTVNFVRLHPNTERCMRLDLARILVEVNLEKPLTERINFLNHDGTLVDIEIMYPWLPSRCSIARSGGILRRCADRRILRF